MSETLEKPVAETARPMSPISRRFGRNVDAAFNRIMARIDDLGLNQNLLELETVGYTVVPVLSEDRIERAKAAILRRVESLTGRKIDPLTATSDDFQGMAYQHYLLYDDPVFQEILLEPKPLALMRLLCVTVPVELNLKLPVVVMPTLEVTVPTVPIAKPLFSKK